MCVVNMGRRLPAKGSKGAARYPERGFPALIRTKCRFRRLLLAHLRPKRGNCRRLGAGKSFNFFFVGLEPRRPRKRPTCEPIVLRCKRRRTKFCYRESPLA